MNHLFTLLVILYTSNLLSQNNIYTIPQFKKGESFSYMGSIESRDYHDFVWHGDSTINGQLFTKVFLNDKLHALVREDTITDSLHVINTLGEKFGAPVLQDLNIGDTVKVFNWHYKLFWDFEYWDNQYYEVDTVKNITQVSINGKLRNKYELDFLSGREVGAHLEYIEGVGISDFIFLSGGISIKCFYEKKELGIDYYQGDPPGCSLNHYYVGNEDVDFQLLNFYPNPTSGIVQYNITRPTQIKVYSVNGKEVGDYLVSGAGHLDFSQFPKGVYFLLDQESFKRQKLVVK